ncbi:MAG: L-lactate permease [Candidatus Eisenbacteria bacterium]|nr:L-lactate permease [Candidatus Latescibacterota bacterium]MBD3302596.1 L-lactate permease [Candidatus Eisenbacteria bacterium]
MNALGVLLAVSPVLVIFLLLVLRRTAADVAGLIGLAVTVVVAGLYFQTAWNVIGAAALAGIVASFPISLMVGASIFQMTFMLETGAVRRIVVTMKSVSPANRIVQILIINVGFGTLVTALGATPVSILPPIMLALGYSSFVAIALPAIGYDSLCTYALLAIPAVVFTDVLAPIARAAGVELTLQQTGFLFARYIPFVTTAIALGMLWIVGRWRMVARGAVPALLTGATAGFVCWAMAAIDLVPLTGIVAGVAIIGLMALLLAVRRDPVYSEMALSDEERGIKAGMSLVRAVSPWVFLLIFATLVNVKMLPFFRVFFEELPMAIPIIPGRPSATRFLWQAYTWVLVSTFAAALFLRPSRVQWGTIFSKSLRRAPRPMLAAAVYFAIALVIDHSGKDAAWALVDPARNMIHLVAGAAAGTFGSAYGLAAPYLGLLAGFISGSETSAIAMLSRFHTETAEALGHPLRIGLLLAAASGIGGGLASVISPAKLQNAAAIIDRIGEEGKVLRTTVPIAIVISLLTAIATLIWVG